MRDKMMHKMSKTGELELRVIDGSQSGASILLDTAKSQLIGNTLDCDICLGKQASSDTQIELIPGNRNASISLLRGTAMLDNKPMQQSKKYKLMLNDTVTLGETKSDTTKFCIARVDNQFTDTEVVENLIDNKQLEHSSVANDTDSDYQRCHNDAITARDPLNSAPVTTAGTGLSNRWSTPMVILLFIGFAVVGTGAAAFNSGAVNSTSPHVAAIAAPIDIAEEVELLDVGELAINKVSADTVIIDGVVKTGADQQKLVQAMEQRSEQVDIKTVLEDDVVSSVKEVFRAYGVTTDITKLKPGRVTVRTESDDLKSLASAEMAAKTDVYGLLELNLINTPPEKTEVPVAVNHQPQGDDPAQSIRMVIFGDPSYVVTEDKTIFYVGALLPTGHRIQSIKETGVVLSKGDVSIELNL